MDVDQGIKPGGFVLINAAKKPQEFKEEFEHTSAKIFTVNATQIALDTIGKPIPNATILGAFVKLSKVVKLESLKKAIDKEVKVPKPIRQKNIQSAEKCYEAIA